MIRDMYIYTHIYEEKKRSNNNIQSVAEVKESRFNQGNNEQAMGVM